MDKHILKYKKRIDFLDLKNLFNFFTWTIIFSIIITIKTITIRNLFSKFTSTFSTLWRRKFTSFALKITSYFSCIRKNLNYIYNESKKGIICYTLTFLCNWFLNIVFGTFTLGSWSSMLVVITFTTKIWRFKTIFALNTTFLNFMI